MKLEDLNVLPFGRAEEILLECCGSKRWAFRMATQRPFANLNSLRESADSVWQDLERADWLEAFGRHPQIGEKATDGPESLRQWAEGEQAAARATTEKVKTTLARGNQAYREKFGYIFLVRATGKSAEEMLALLDHRLQNDPAHEMHIAAEQQRLITRLRLEKLLTEERSSQ